MKWKDNYIKRKEEERRGAERRRRGPLRSCCCHTRCLRVRVGGGRRSWRHWVSECECECRRVPWLSCGGWSASSYRPFPISGSSALVPCPSSGNNGALCSALLLMCTRFFLKHENKWKEWRRDETRGEEGKWRRKAKWRREKKRGGIEMRWNMKRRVSRALK